MVLLYILAAVNLVWLLPVLRIRGSVFYDWRNVCSIFIDVISAFMWVFYGLLRGNHGVKLRICNGHTKNYSSLFPWVTACWLGCKWECCELFFFVDSWVMSALAYRVCTCQSSWIGRLCMFRQIILDVIFGFFVSCICEEGVKKSALVRGSRYVPYLGSCMEYVERECSG